MPVRKDGSYCFLNIDRHVKAGVAEQVLVKAYRTAMDYLVLREKRKAYVLHRQGLPSSGLSEFYKIHTALLQEWYFAPEYVHQVGQSYDDKDVCDTREGLITDMHPA